MKNVKKSLFTEKGDLSIKALVVWCVIYALIASAALLDMMSSKAHADDHGVKVEWLPTNEVPSQLEWLDLDEFFGSESAEKKASRDERQQALEKEEKHPELTEEEIKMMKEVLSDILEGGVKELVTSGFMPPQSASGALSDLQKQCGLK